MSSGAASGASWIAHARAKTSREPRAATHRPEAYEIAGEGGREQRDEDRTELVVPMRPAAVNGDER